MDINQYSHDAYARDGLHVHLRAIRPDDKQRLLDGFHRLTGKSVYFRFFTAKQELTEKELNYFTEIDFEHHVAIVATIKSEEKDKLIGVGRYIRLQEKGLEGVAEVAFAVDDEHQNLGIGTILFKQLVTLAKKQGITRLEADVLLSNANMLAIFEKSGFKLDMMTGSGVVHIEFDIVNK